MQNQVNALNSFGIDVSLINHDNHFIYLNSTKIVSRSITNTFKRYWNNIYSFWTDLGNQVNFQDYDFIYIRYPGSSPSLISFCHKAKLSKSDLKIIIEVPTFPYNQELEGISYFYSYIDNYYRKKLKPYVNKIVHFGEENKLFGIETIRTTNGINIDNIPISTAKKEGNKIRLVAVGKWFFWHGLDRLFQGLKIYYNNSKNPVYDITLKIVGGGKELSNYKRLVEKTEVLKNRVTFTGIKIGEELTDIYNSSDIGIGTIGIHRKGLTYNASLKHREYCARGLPFILSTKDNCFPSELKFIEYISEDEVPVDINSIIELYQKNIKKQEIRNYAKDNLDWKSIMKSILEQSDIT